MNSLYIYLINLYEKCFEKDKKVHDNHNLETIIKKLPIHYTYITDDYKIDNYTIDNITVKVRKKLE